MKEFMVNHGDNIVYDNVNLTKKGKVFIVIGRNGMGKTSLFNVLYGKLDYKGSLKLNNEEIRGLNQNKISKIFSYVKQEISLFYNLTPLENAKLLKVNVKRFCLYMKILKKENILNRAIKLLSGGEKQIVNLFLGLSKDSEILLLDEPFNNISVKNKKIIEYILDKDKRPKLIITHKNIRLKGEILYIKNKGINCV